MKKDIKLCFTDTHEHIAIFFYNILSLRYNIVIDNDDPECVIFGDDNFGHNNRRFSKKDVLKIFYTGENRRPENFDCHYAISFDHNFNQWHYRLPLFVIYMWAMEYIHKIGYRYDHILNLPEPKEKIDFCSFVVSNPNCEQRNSFFDKLNTYKKVDSAGRFKKNIEVDLATLKNKIDFIGTRKFNICFENSSYPGYVTEKILDAFYAGSIPIYWGSQTVDLDFNPNAFINVNNYRSYDDVIEDIIKIDSDDVLYNQIIRQPKFKYNVPPNYFFFDNLLNWFDAAINRKLEAKL